ncbi:hypothetical protein SK128_002780, partial [Halocaridina rubra]
NAERQLLRRSSSVTGRGPGRPPAYTKREDSVEVTEAILDIENQKLGEIQRRGCIYALQYIANYFGEELPEKVPQLWDLINGNFKISQDSEITLENSQSDINWLQLLEVVIPALHPQIIAQ